MGDGRLVPPTPSGPAVRGPVLEPFAISCVDLVVGPIGQPGLSGVDLDLPAGSISTVLGAAGSGQAVLVDAMLGREPARQGRIRVGPCDPASASAGELAELRRRVSVLPAPRPGVDLPAPGAATVRQILLTNLYAWDGAGTPGPDLADGVERAAGLTRRAGDWLERLDLRGLADRTTEELSPVELRRLALAVALSVDAPLYLLEDPDIALDDAHRDAVVEAFRATHRRTGATMVVITNDLVVAERVSDRVLVLAGGRVAFNGVPSEAFADLGYLRVPAHAPDLGRPVEQAAPEWTPRPGRTDPAVDPLGPATEHRELRPVGCWPLDLALTAAAFALLILVFLLVLPRGA